VEKLIKPIKIKPNLDDVLSFINEVKLW
jgi:hypothetical protein